MLNAPLPLPRGVAAELKDLIERDREEIVDRTLSLARQASARRTLALTLVARTFVGRVLDGLASGDLGTLRAWVASVDHSSSPALLEDVRAVIVSGCVAIAGHFAGRPEGATIARLFRSLATELDEEFERCERVAAGSHANAIADEATAALLSALGARDAGTVAHLHAVATWCGRLATTLQLAPPFVRFVERCGLLHDVGKIATLRSALTSGSQLDAAGRAAMRNHPADGARILESVPALRNHATAALEHHERFDGGGYPNGVRGTAIPLEARIVAVADAFHAMTSDQPYRAAISPTEALAELVRERGAQFDPQIVDAMVATVSEHRVSRREERRQRGSARSRR